MKQKTRTPKQTVLMAEPRARCDFYESLRGAGKPCWFIRIGYQGRALSDISASPRAAWRNSAELFLASLRRLA
jgi:hypothetical protein